MRNLTLKCTPGYPVPTSGIGAYMAELGHQVAVQRKRFAIELTAARVQNPITDRPTTIVSAPPHERRT